MLTFSHADVRKFLFDKTTNHKLLWGEVRFSKRKRNKLEPHAPKVPPFTDVGPQDITEVDIVCDTLNKKLLAKQEKMNENQGQQSCS